MYLFRVFNNFFLLFRISLWLWNYTSQVFLPKYRHTSILFFYSGTRSSPEYQSFSNFWQFQFFLRTTGTSCAEIFFPVLSTAVAKMMSAVCFVFLDSEEQRTSESCDALQLILHWNLDIFMWPNKYWKIFYLLSHTFRMTHTALHLRKYEATLCS